MAWQKVATDTATSSVSSQNLTLEGLQFNTFMVHKITSSLNTTNARFDNDSGTKYATRQSFNGGTDATTVNDTDIALSTGNNNEDELTVGYFCDISGEEKLMIHHTISQNTDGAGNIPKRKEIVGKFTDTTSLTSMDIIYENANADTDTNSTVLGTD